MSSILTPFLRLFQATVQSHQDHDGDETTRVSHVPDLVITADGWFDGEDVERVPTRRTQSLVTPEPLGLCWHWTATRGAGRRLAENIRDLPKKGERSASWGTLIPRSGPMYLSAPLTRGTWHAGGPSAHSFSVWHLSHRAYEMKMTDRTMSTRLGGEVSANSLLHGIEIENVGEVRMVTRGWNKKRQTWEALKPAWRGWPFDGNEKDDRGPGPVVPEDEVVREVQQTRRGISIRRGYHAFSDHQISQAERLVRACHRKYGWTEHDMSFTHKMIDPTRKSDPVPEWPRHLEGIFARVL